MQITQIQVKRYTKLSKKEKGKVLEDYAKEYGVSKNLASKRFRQASLSIKPLVLKGGKDRPCKKRGPKTKYTPRCISIIKVVWELYQHICAERLHPQIGKGIDILLNSGRNAQKGSEGSNESNTDKPKNSSSTDTVNIPTKANISKKYKINYTEEDIKICRKISLGKLKKEIAKFDKPDGYRRNNRKPGIHKRVPIQTNFHKHAMEDGIGYIAVDPVEHNGGNSSGKYIYTGTYVDVYSQWIARSSSIGGNLESIQNIHDRNESKIPFTKIKYHSDNAKALLKILFKKATGEDIAKEDGISIEEVKEKYTRSRPNTPKDNAHVEQKNGDKVRKLVGYHRYDTEEQNKLLNKIYDIEDIITNYFIPSQKLVKAEYNAMGKLIRKTYDKAKTPYQRVLEDKSQTKEQKEKLTTYYKSLNLIELRLESEQLHKELFLTISRK